VRDARARGLLHKARRAKGDARCPPPKRVISRDARRDQDTQPRDGDSDEERPAARDCPLVMDRRRTPDGRTLASV